MIPIPVSSSTTSTFVLRIVDVDFELRLFQAGSEVFDAGRGQVPKEHPLTRNARYLLRYNNNDGGPGALHFDVLEDGAHRVTRYTVNLATIHSPTVMEFEFELHPQDGLSTG